MVIPHPLGSGSGSIKIALTIELLLAENIDECIQKRLAFIKSRAHLKKEYTDV
jgi:hypothetical protein